MNRTGAFLIFKDTKVYIDKLSIRQTGELFKALFEYANSGEVPVMSEKVDIIFEVFKRIVDSNEQKYITKCEYNKKAYAKKKDLTQIKEPACNTPPAVKNKELESRQNSFISEFAKEFPKKALDVDLTDYKDIDFKALLIEIKKSKFLTTSDNLSLKWCLEHSKDILDGKYKTYQLAKQNFKGREYTREELNAYFQDIDNIEV